MSLDTQDTYERNETERTNPLDRKAMAMQDLLNDGRELNSDLQEVLVLNTSGIEWEKVPATTVWRKRLDHIKDATTGRETSLMRFEPNTSVPTEKLTTRMEILVLDGSYSDGHREYPAGTYILNPPGFTHTPSSNDGCELYVQKRQSLGIGCEHVVIDTKNHEWSPRFTGKMIRLYEDDSVREEMHIGLMPAGQSGADHDHPGGEEVLILDGAMEDENGVYGKGTWLRFPGSFRHETISKDGCLMYVREGDVG